MNSSSLFDAIGVSKVEVLSEDGERLLCRGWRDSGDGDQKAILAVLLSVEHPALGSLSQLTHEFELKDDLHDSWAVQPLELARAHGRTMLVLKDPGGEPLRCLLLGAPMVLERFLRLAVALAAALGHMHKRGIVHKDIKPTNLIVNSATGLPANSIYDYNSLNYLRAHSELARKARLFSYRLFGLPPPIPDNDNRNVSEWGE